MELKNNVNRERKNIMDGKSVAKLYGQRKEKCSFCGKEQNNEFLGQWVADIAELFCCYACAMNTLPCFLADSIPEANNVEDHLHRIMEKFWRTCYIRYK